jgi:hypothetical protein
LRRLFQEYRTGTTRCSCRIRRSILFWTCYYLFISVKFQAC